ncbi:MAG TPA: hypothetical protein ACQGQH_04085 [Xylella sp.]
MQIIETLYLSTSGLAELRFAITVPPEGNLQDTLYKRFEDRVLL